MAERPVFIPFAEGNRFVREMSIEFVWNPGLAPTQKKKNVLALHAAAAGKGLTPLLEVSTKSDLPLGMRLSAFNLPIELHTGTMIPLECAFQGSKVFQNGGPYRDIYRRTSYEAKKDERLRTSGSVIGFRFAGFDFPAEPKTAFYDWLYVRALNAQSECWGQLKSFAGFTDIEFNPSKSVNCQARSCALFVSLWSKGLIDVVLNSPSKFIEVISADSFQQPYSNDLRQGKLF